MSLSKHLRFEVFKRDLFRCVYCGRTPPAVTLQADHVLAVANGGEDIPENLVTSCADCNGGKGARPLDVSALPPVTDALDHEIERNEQALQYNLYLREIRCKREADLSDIDAHWTGRMGWPMKDGELGIFRNALREFVPEQLKEAIDIASGKDMAPSNRIRYLCGILRRWREERKR